MVITIDCKEALKYFKAYSVDFSLFQSLLDLVVYIFFCKKNLK